MFEAAIFLDSNQMAYWYPERMLAVADVDKRMKRIMKCSSSTSHGFIDACAAHR